MEKTMKIPDFEKVQENLKKVKRKIMVLSGKGGVGKSTIAFSLASFLARSGKSVGLVDSDFHGPSIPRLVSAKQQEVKIDHERIIPPQPYENMKVMSIGFMLDSPRDAVIWRGPLKFGMVKSFLSDVEWGELDYLVIDLPPGTGDESLSICQLLPTETAALIVTTPQAISVSDVRRAITFCGQLKAPVIGIVENMSGLVCPHCGEKIEIFSHGGGEKLAEETGVDYLGSLPINPEIVKLSDEGRLYENMDGIEEFVPVFSKVVDFFDNK